MRKVSELIELFAIGIIIFDEIQLIDFSSAKENFFEALLVLTNQTKVAIAVIGTEDAYQKMFTNLRTTRRIGPTISGSTYCGNRAFCDYIIGRLFRYQWFDNQIKPIPEIANAMYEHTCGIIDQLIGLYMHMQMTYLSTSPRPTVNAKFIEDICKKYYPGVQKLLDDITNPTAQKELQKVLQEANSSFDLKIGEAKQLIRAKEIMNSTSAQQHNVLKRNIIANVRAAASEFSEEAIATAFDKIIDV